MPMAVDRARAESAGIDAASVGPQIGIRADAVTVDDRRATEVVREKLPTKRRGSDADCLSRLDLGSDTGVDKVIIANPRSSLE